jgi:mannose-1-phosphate guanylyltransferase
MLGVPTLPAERIISFFAVRVNRGPKVNISLMNQNSQIHSTFEVLNEFNSLKLIWAICNETGHSRMQQNMKVRANDK